MDLIELPLLRLMGIEADDAGRLTLPLADAVRNHLGTMHAGAQFTLAEAASALCLQRVFPDLVAKVVPVLRASQAKYRKAASSDVYAVGRVADEDRDAFMSQFARKGRGSVAVAVEVRDDHDKITFQGTFEWYVQTVA